MCTRQVTPCALQCCLTQKGSAPIAHKLSLVCFSSVWDCHVELVNSNGKSSLACVSTWCPSVACLAHVHANRKLVTVPAMFKGMLMKARRHT